MPSHARSTVGSREAEVCFEVTPQAWRRLSSLVEATSGRGAHRRVTVHEANEAARHGAEAGDEERWQAQGEPGG
jgi:hypothetical protein